MTQALEIPIRLIAYHRQWLCQLVCVGPGEGLYRDAYLPLF
jgi:hypothetical protein